MGFIWASKNSIFYFKLDSLEPNKMRREESVSGFVCLIWRTDFWGILLDIMHGIADSPTHLILSN